MDPARHHCLRLIQINIFDTEHEYYRDIQQSKYCITTKRSGWDCLRHYEIAANRSVICFKNLHLKPVKCAPHGLIPGPNCLSYSNYDDLMDQISLIDESAYQHLQSNCFDWVLSHTTVACARRLIDDFMAC